jgi:DNA-binding response OmpR family regulator
MKGYSMKKRMLLVIDNDKKTMIDAKKYFYDYDIIHYKDKNITNYTLDQFDLIIIDIFNTSEKILESIKQSIQMLKKEIPIFVYSNKDLLVCKMKALNKGADDYIIKPNIQEIYNYNLLHLL